MSKKNRRMRIVNFGGMYAEVTPSTEVSYGKTPVLYIDLSGNSYAEFDLTVRRRKAYANKLRKLAELIESVQ